MRSAVLWLLLAAWPCAAQEVEPWASPDIGVRLSCRDTTPFTCALPANAKYGTWPDQASCAVSGPNGCYSPSNNHLYFHGVAFPIVTAKAYQAPYLSIETTISAYCGPGISSKCFAGLTLYNGEQNYREIAYSNGEIHRTSNCEDKALYNSHTGAPLTVGRNEPHKLRLDYLSGKWAYYVDDQVQWISPQGATTEPPYAETPCGQIDEFIFSQPPHWGLFLVGLEPGAYAEGNVGPVSMYNGMVIDQSQPLQSDGYTLSQTTWVAQYVSMGGANISAVRLFLILGKQYQIDAMTNNGGIPGTAIASTNYQASAYGLQDIPLYVPRNYPGVWIVVKGSGDIGRTALGAKPYAGDFLFTTNSGHPWVLQNANLTFQTLAR